MSKNKFLIILVIALISLSGGRLAAANDVWRMPLAVYYNFHAYGLITSQRFESAHSVILEALKYAPDQPEFFLNLGLIYTGKKDVPNALRAYQACIQLAQDDFNIKFLCLFNGALLYSQNGDLDKALTFYQQALALKQDSYEVRVNIELLFQQQQGGKGSGNNKQDNSDNDEKNDGQDKQYAENPQPPKPKFNSKELTPDDVQKIFSEIKRQEQQIRGKMYGDTHKEPPRDKDW